MFGLIDLLYIKCFSIIFSFFYLIYCYLTFLQVLNNFFFIVTSVSFFQTQSQHLCLSVAVGSMFLGLLISFFGYG